MNEWNYTSTLHIRLNGVGSENFTEGKYGTKCITVASHIELVGKEQKFFVHSCRDKEVFEAVRCI